MARNEDNDPDDDDDDDDQHFPHPTTPRCLIPH
jgi:hypothetical protein